MGSDLSMNPPPATRYVALKNSHRMAIYRYQPDRIYNFSSPDWIRTLDSMNIYEDFAKATGMRIYETTLENFPLNLTPAAMADIMDPPKPKYIGRHRKVNY